MATIYNTELTKELRDSAKLQNRDRIPSELAEKVVPVMEVNPKLLRRVDFLTSGANSTSAASVTVQAADPNNDTFVTHLQYSMVKDATCDAASGNFTTQITLDGATSTLTTIPVLTLTAQNVTFTMNFSTPIKIDRNTSVRFTMPTFTAGNCRINLAIGGYKVYNTKA